MSNELANIECVRVKIFPLSTPLILKLYSLQELGLNVSGIYESIPELMVTIDPDPDFNEYMTVKVSTRLESSYNKIITLFCNYQSRIYLRYHKDMEFDLPVDLVDAYSKLDYKLSKNLGVLFSRICSTLEDVMDYYPTPE